ncbi:hypothetical protein MRB53_028871 [Persea americana]|uniref:Uncharacterized protein n=1 Tax=Persea americana TaxID=3435 RepID=A0ACC2KH82_PERAE|nr:hypothetical protein MRB53_028871 [Persea americana]
MEDAVPEVVGVIPSDNVIVDKTLNLLEGLPLDLSRIKCKVNGILGKARLLTEARDSNSFDTLHQTVLEKLVLICHEEKLNVQKVDEVTSASSQLKAEEIGLCSTCENLEKEISSIEEQILSLQGQVVMKRHEVNDIRDCPHKIAKETASLDDALLDSKNDLNVVVEQKQDLEREVAQIVPQRESKHQATTNLESSLRELMQELFSSERI